jgi:uncharacterized coiled-coil DUF342 family protein
MTRDEMEEVKRHFGVVADGLRSEIRLVAEGHAALDEKLDETRQEMSEFHREFLEFLKDIQVEFRELRALIKLSYVELDERLKNVERELLLLKSRLDDLEGRRA